MSENPKHESFENIFDEGVRENTKNAPYKAKSIRQFSRGIEGLQKFGPKEFPELKKRDTKPEIQLMPRDYNALKAGFEITLERGAQLVGVFKAGMVVSVFSSDRSQKPSDVKIASVDENSDAQTGIKSVVIKLRKKTKVKK